MAVPSLDHEFMEYWSKLTLVQKESLLKVVKSFVEPERDKAFLEQYNREINEAIERFKAGKHISHDDVEKMAKDW